MAQGNQNREQQDQGKSSNPGASQSERSQQQQQDRGQARQGSQQSQRSQQEQGQASQGERNRPSGVENEDLDMDEDIPNRPQQGGSEGRR